LLSGCKIVPLSEVGANAAAAFDAEVYAAGLWTEQALPHFTSGAHPAEVVIPHILADLSAAGTDYGNRAGEGSPWSFIVSGTGQVIGKNTDSRAGTIIIALQDAPEATEAVLQIGPVIRGNAIRDALPFVSFQNFTNQLEYAEVGKALTALAVAGFSGNVDALAIGDTVSFTGAISMAGASDKLLITPVRLQRAAP
jgi:predicted lipoprotein